MEAQAYQGGGAMGVGYECNMSATVSGFSRANGAEPRSGLMLVQGLRCSYRPAVPHLSRAISTVSSPAMSQVKGTRTWRKSNQWEPSPSALSVVGRESSQPDPDPDPDPLRPQPPPPPREGTRTSHTHQTSEVNSPQPQYPVQMLGPLLAATAVAT